jgi:hypothetical protein
MDNGTICFLAGFAAANSAAGYIQPFFSMDKGNLAECNQPHRTGTP